MSLPRNPSAEFIRLNSHLFGGKTPQQAAQIIATASPVRPKAPRTMSAPALNKTEQRWQDEHPSHIPFPMSLRWGNCMYYKPDFMEDGRVNGEPILKPRLIEVKGAHIYSRDLVRFKGCAAEWGWHFTFELHQWKDRKWTRLY